MHPEVHCSIIHSGQDMERTQASFDRGLDKEDVVPTHKGTLRSHKKGWNTAICDNRDGPWEHYAKWNKSEKAKNHMTSLICGI